MQQTKAIPDKLFFKIGEVCELLQVQPHVLRYWESEFPALSPQKSRSGQRAYRRKDVEIAMRIKQLLYEEGFTIAGAKRKLQAESRATKLKVVPPDAVEERTAPVRVLQLTDRQRKALMQIKTDLQALLTKLSKSI
ncbi:MAG: MerR family transcriptional regulator [Acidobacteriota bacterium]|nr:MerR family transcriptional regulator [Blastocatellia bacterium]MDW8412347.1 MerR family transcriptional regulator [Acidobacteriota bacterium]